MKRWLFCIIAALPLYSNFVKADIFGSGAAYVRGDFAQAVKLLRPLAGKGDLEAQDKRGVLYDQGVVAHDYQEASKWYRLSAEQGK